MRIIYYLICVSGLLLSSLFLEGQTIIIKGILLNKEDSIPVYNVVVTLNPDMRSSVSNQNGEFFFETTAGKKELTTRILGFKQEKYELICLKDTSINIFLEIDPFQFKEVTITGDSIKSVIRSDHGNIILSRASLHEVPRFFSEPDLVKLLQSLPGVVSGKEGTTDLFVRGGSPGQNIFLTNGCYFFLPSHLLGFTSGFDLDFIDKTELIKDYFPADIGGGASSIIKIDYSVPNPDSARVQLRLGLLTSGFTFQIPFQKIGLGITGGIKRGNYSIYAPILKTLLDKNITDYLPPEDYSFYDSYIRITHSTAKVGELSYVFMRNHDKGSKSNITESNNADTLLTAESGFSTWWTNQLHSLEWTLPVKGKTLWIYDLNFNKITIERENFLKYDKYLNANTLIDYKYTSYRFSPNLVSIGTKVYFVRTEAKGEVTGGLYYRFREFTPGVLASDFSDKTTNITKFVDGYLISEPAAFISGNYKLPSGWLFECGARLSAVILEEARFICFEPRLRVTHEISQNLSNHVNYVRLSQFDHSLESSNIGLRSMLWLPVNKEFGPEISDVYSVGINGKANKYNWSVDLYFKTMNGMVDFKPGASFLYATSINELLDKITGRSYGAEIFLIKKIGKLNGYITYTYSRSKREWYAPEGKIWIPSVADRPHNLSVALKYFLKRKTAIGLNWVYSSGLPATMYTHNTLYGRWFETKNNIRYPDYHRLDFSLRKTFKIKNISLNLDFDISNVYNRRNTFYLKEVFDETRKTFIYKNISLFPIMPSISISIQNSWNMK